MTDYSHREQEILYVWAIIAERQMRRDGRHPTLEHLSLLAKVHVGASFPSETRLATEPVPVRPCEQIGATEAAKRLGITPQAVRKRCAAGTLPAKQVGRSWLIDWTEAA